MAGLEPTYFYVLVSGKQSWYCKRAAEQKQMYQNQESASEQERMQNQKETGSKILTFINGFP